MKARALLLPAAALVAGAVVPLLVVPPAAGPARATTSGCPSGYFPDEVRVYGQRLESQPHKDGSTTKVVVQNDNGGEDPRYVVVRACVRPLTDGEQDDLYWLGVPGGRPPRG